MAHVSATRPGACYGAADDDPSGIATDLPALPFTIGFAVVSVALQMFISYTTYARYLRWLTLVLLSYVAVLFVAEVDWLAAAKGFLAPEFPLSGDSFTMIVAILGTTISPYLLFWQSSQEVEEIHHDTLAKPLVEAPNQAKREIRRIRLDTFVGMAVSNVVALATIMSTAATLHAAGKPRSTAPPTCGGVAPDCRRFCHLYLQSGDRWDRAVVSAGAGRVGSLRLR